MRFSITPEPTPEDREAILAAVKTILDREAALRRPTTWTLSGWTQRRTGITDLGRDLDARRRWALSARMPWGGREFPGLNGRGDAK